MNFEKVWLIDFLKDGEQHADFYLGVISVLRQITLINRAFFKKNSICLKNLDKETKIFILKNHRNKIFMHIYLFNLICNIFIKAFLKKPKNVLFLQVLPVHYPLLSILRLFVPKTNILICMAGELSILGRRDLNFFHKIYKKCILISLKMNLSKIKNLKFLCLEKRVFDNLKKLGINENLVDHIQHYIFRNYSPKLYIQRSRKKYAASIGVHSKLKNSQDIYKLLNFNQNKYSLATSGLSDDSFKYKKNTNIKHFFQGTIQNRYIPVDILFKKIEENIEVVLFFHTGASGYEYVCSGQIYDLIWLRKPAICFENSPLAKYKNYFDFPIYTVDNIEEMNDKLIEIFNSKPDNEKFNISNDELRNLALKKWRKILY